MSTKEIIETSGLAIGFGIVYALIFIIEAMQAGF